MAPPENLSFPPLPIYYECSLTNKFMIKGYILRTITLSEDKTQDDSPSWGAWSLHQNLKIEILIFLRDVNTFKFIIQRNSILRFYFIY